MKLLSSFLKFLKKYTKLDMFCVHTHTVVFYQSLNLKLKTSSILYTN